MISSYKSAVLFVDADNMANGNIPPNTMNFLKNFLKCELHTMYVAGNNKIVVRRWELAGKASFKDSNIEAVTVGLGKDNADIEIIFKMSSISDDEILKNSCHIIMLTGDKLILRAAEKLQEKGFAVVIITPNSQSLLTRTSLPLMIFPSLTHKDEIKDGREHGDEKNTIGKRPNITLPNSKVTLLKSILDIQNASVIFSRLKLKLQENDFCEPQITEILTSMGFDESSRSVVGKKELMKWFDKMIIHSVAC
jgi:uncharacterized LabA/DUF88 family protein